MAHLMWCKLELTECIKTNTCVGLVTHMHAFSSAKTIFVGIRVFFGSEKNGFKKAFTCFYLCLFLIVHSGGPCKSSCWHRFLFCISASVNDLYWSIWSLVLIEKSEYPERKVYVYSSSMLWYSRSLEPGDIPCRLLCFTSPLWTVIKMRTPLKLY